MSYRSAQDPRLHFGLGTRKRLDGIEILWPSGEVTRLGDITADQIVCVKEGFGVVRREFPKIR